MHFIVDPTPRSLPDSYCPASPMSPLTQSQTADQRSFIMDWVHHYMF